MNNQHFFPFDLNVFEVMKDEIILKIQYSASKTPCVSIQVRYIKHYCECTL